MSRAKAILAVFVAPLVGTVAWQVQTMLQSMKFGRPNLFDAAVDDPLGMLAFTAIGWLRGVVLTVIVGLPIGALAAYLLRRIRIENMLTFVGVGAIASLLFSMLLPSRNEFWMPIVVTGALLGAAYWSFVRKHTIISEVTFSA